MKNFSSPLKQKKQKKNVHITTEKSPNCNCFFSITNQY